MPENLNTLYYALELDDIKMQKSFEKDIQYLSKLDDEFNKINASISKTFGQKISVPIHNDIKQLVDELKMLERQWNSLNIVQKRGTEGIDITSNYEKLNVKVNELNRSLATLYNESLQSAKNHEKSLKDEEKAIEKLILAEEKRERAATRWYFKTQAKEALEFSKQQERAALATEKLAIALKKQREARQIKQSSGEFKEYIQSLTRQSDISKQMSAYYKSLERQTARTAAEQEKMANAQKRIASEVNKVNGEFTLQSRLLSNLKTLFTTYVSIFAVKSFIQNLAQVRGEFENQQIALRAILRDAEAADKIFSQIKSFAVISPFEFKDLVSYAKQLSAFQVPVNELFETTKRLADVSAGLGVGMDRIILAYGQVRSAAVLRGQELRQFTEAGIPLVDELAKKFSELEGRVVSAGDVFEKISNRMVSFEMVKEIFEDMTNEGGMFYMMQEKQAESLKGKIANLADAYDIMLNDIGEANDGILKGGVEGIATLFENWEKVLKILGSVIASYGTYKAVLISVSAIQKINIATTMAAEYLKMAKNLGFATANMIAFNRASLMNPYTLLATGIAAVVGSLILFSKESETISDRIDNLERSTNNFINSGERIDHLITNYEELSSKTNRTDAENKKLTVTMNELNKIVPNVTKSFDEYGNALDVNIEKVKQFTEAERKANKQRLEENLAASEQDIENLKKAISERTKILSMGGQMITKTQFAGEATISYELWEALDSPKRNEILDSLEKLRENLSKVENTAYDAKVALGIVVPPAKESKDFSISIQDLNDKLDKLSGKYKEEEINIAKVIDKEKTLNQVKEETITMYKQYESAYNGYLESQKAGLKINESEMNSSKKRMELFKERARILGILDELENKKENTKDPNAERLKEQIDLLKKAQAQYEKYLQIMSPDEAVNAIRLDKQFMALDIQFEPNKVRERLQSIMNEITKLQQSPELDKLKISIQSAFTDIDYTDAKKNFDKFLTDLTQELDSYKNKYNFYEQLLGITGNQDLAVNLAFNGNFEKAGEGIVEQIQQGMLKAASSTGLTLDQIMNLDFSKSADELGISEELKKFLQKSVDEIGKIQVGNILDFQKLIAEYSAVEDKIKAIQNKGYAERAKINETYSKARIDVDIDTYTALEEQQLAAMKASKQREDEAIRGLMSEMLQLTPFWQKLFGDLDELGYRSLTELSDKAKEVVESAKVNEDKDGKVLGYTVEYDKKSYDISVELFEKLRRQSNSLDKDLKKSNPFKTLFKTLKEGPQEGEDFFDFATRISKSLNDIIVMAIDVGSSLSEMFDAIGNDKAAEAIDFSLQLGEALGNMLTDLSSGNPVQMVTGMVKGVAKIVTLFSQKHDNKLEKQIQESALAVQKLQDVYSELERMISRSLGGAENLDLGIEYTPERLAEINNQLDTLRAKSKNNILFRIIYSSNIKELEKEQRKLQAYEEGGVYAVQRENLIRQQEELIKQRQAEIDKKKTDQSKVLDYENQIKELDDTIRHFAEDTLKNLYDIDLKDWASQIGDSLVDAFSRGEDAAAAFDSTISDLMRNVTKKMVSLNILEPMFEKLRTYLFGSDGKSGAFGGDFKLNTEEVAGMKSYIDEIKNKGIPASQELYDAINKALGGIMDLGAESGGSFGKDIKGVTENTANLLGSYINAIRSSSALQEVYQKNIATNVSGIYRTMGDSPNITTTIPPEIMAAISEPFKLNNSLLASIDANMNNVHSIAANALAQLVMIQANTYNTAMATRDTVEELRGVISPGHSKGGSGIKVLI